MIARQDVVLVPLTKEKVAKVSPEDWKRLEGISWSYLSSTGYAQGWHEGKTIYMHRFILNAPKGLFVDYINHDRLDNTRGNLRLVTPQQNILNQRPYGKSKYKGVRKRNGKFQVRITIQGKQRVIGTFPNEIDAALAYDQFAKAYFGHIAYLNFPDKKA